jgi:2,5-dihydroxypyridine 5,6-dioxygenase
MYTTIELISLFREELKLCRLSSGERVVVAGQNESPAGYLEAALAAAESLGARACGILLPRFKHTPLPRCSEGEIRDVNRSLERLPHLFKVFEDVDIVIDVTAEGPVHTRVRPLILGRGARMLHCDGVPGGSGADVPPALPCEGVASVPLRRARSMRVLSEAGTDVTFQLAESMPALAQYGYTDQPGRWDHWPGGFVACYPTDAEGRIVLNTGRYLIAHESLRGSSRGDSHRARSYR